MILLISNPRGCFKYSQKIPDNVIDLIVTSPPYNIGISYPSWNDNMDWNDYYAWCSKWLIELLRVLKMMVDFV